MNWATYRKNECMVDQIPIEHSEYFQIVCDENATRKHDKTLLIYLKGECLVLKLIQ